MTERSGAGWRKEFGVQDRTPPAFFANKGQLTPAFPQSHVLRRAFDLLNLDGIFCAENVPLVYFKLVDNITPQLVYVLHRQFWNHGGAPILVLISTDKVHVYSGMCRPVPTEPNQKQPPSLITTLDRVSDGLQKFLASVESGDFFRRHASSFDPARRIDRDLLKNMKDTRDVLDEITQRQIAPQKLDALLCRLVFTCYLFDREVIGAGYLRTLGLSQASHLRDVLSLQPTRDAKAALYRLFQRLGRDFNGDLFSDDLEAESRQITSKHIETLKEFFHGTLVRTGQTSFWPYDFSAIPIEAISAIYEHFLKAGDHKAGAFYTPRFLAEIVLNTALEGFGTLLGRRFLDPACGSGIFLVALFNRMAEEWRHLNPTARNDRRARELMQLLRRSLFGVDTSPTACRITAFSLYLAYLDQLAPRDIQKLQASGRALPQLVASIPQPKGKSGTMRGNIQCTDFFSEAQTIPTQLDLVIGNPPWGSIATDGTPANQWCKKNNKSLPDNQIATAFVWKSAEHISERGRVCLVLPHGTLFNHSTTAVQFQKEWLTEHSLSKVLNLADFRLFLFEKAIHPAIVVCYRKSAERGHSKIEYWAPKADWLATQAEVITVSSMDRAILRADDVLRDLNGPDAPQAWKQRFWGTPRDLRLLDRLSLYPRLRDHVRSSHEKSDKPWLIAEGFQPLGKNDDPEEGQSLELPSKRFIPATSVDLDLFLLTQDCTTLKSATVTVRGRSNKNTDVFRAPHVLITKGFQRIAFSDFDVSFRHALRGIHGPEDDRDLLIFLAAYLRTPIARYFLFHTSSSWGMYRPEGHVEEVLRLPMPLPDQLPNVRRAKAIVEEVAAIVRNYSERAANTFMGRELAVQKASDEIEPLVEEYFDIRPLDKLLIADTINMTIPSIQPTQSRMPVPTVRPSEKAQRDAYKKCVCEMLNHWATGGNAVRGMTVASEAMGVGVAVLEKVLRAETDLPMHGVDGDLIQSLHRIRQLASTTNETVEIVRGLMIFDQNRLYLVKPIGQRYWTQTAALNDADEIANTILMHAEART